MSFTDSAPFSITIAASAGGAAAALSGAAAVGVSAVGPLSGGSGAPAWFTGLADKTWTYLTGGVGFQSGATLLSVYQAMPGTNQSAFGALIAPWVGGVVDQSVKRLIFCANGGHGDYWGNEVYACELNVATPYWRRLADFSPLSAYASNPPNTPAPGGQVAKDLYGRSAAMHTSNSQCYGNGKIWTMSQSAYANMGQSTSAVFSYDLNNAALLAANNAGNPLAFSTDAGPWTYIGNASGGIGSFGTGAYDKVGLRAYGAATDQGNFNSAFCSVSATSSVLSNHTVLSVGNLQSGACVVAHDLRLLIFIDQTGAVNVLDITTPASPGTPTAVTVTGPWTVGPVSSYAWGCVYHQPSSSILLYNVNNSQCNGGIVIKIKIPRTGNAYNPSGTWVASNISPTAGQPAAQASIAGGTYGKFGLIEDMGNGAGLLIACLGANAAYTFVYKLPAGELL